MNKILLHFDIRCEKSYVKNRAARATTVTLVIAFWPFDNNTLDLYGAYDGTLIGNGSYTTSFLGYGAALNFVQSSSQFVSIASSQLLLNSRSFTIEAWIYLRGSAVTDYGIFGQCPSTSANLCFDFMTRSNRLYCAIYNNSVQGGSTLTLNTWYHVACVYDASTQTQSVWLNGVVDGSSSASAYQDTSGTTTIGAIYNSSSTVCLNGYIDQVRYETIAKTASEILDDATLYVYYSFDSSSLIDNGPNGINGTSFGNLMFTAGRVNEAAQFSAGAYISYTYTPFYFLGILNHPFSISLWAKPMGSYRASTLVFVDKGASWCMHFLVMTSTGLLSANLWNGGNVGVNGPILPLNSWTHIGYTYSTTNGIQLYINSTLYATSGSITFSASGVPMYMHVKDIYLRETDEGKQKIYNKPISIAENLLQNINTLVDVETKRKKLFNDCYDILSSFLNFYYLQTIDPPDKKFLLDYTKEFDNCISRNISLCRY
ncbi:unnamed protein product [Rotaria socialis]|uniref:LamG-like jellyroll fold domain-containing protein n=1 Tax=Rotaria socialis TaxID=392032 RepID=A0A818DV80_9BILA|nr:unnamed protein product [Rotaria socialis]